MSRTKKPSQLSQIWQQLGGVFGIGRSSQPFRAHCSGFRASHSPLSQIVHGRRPPLPHIPLEGGGLYQEPYLRPLRQCDSHAPEIIGLAQMFRQGVKNDWEYAQAIYNFVCNEIIFAITPPPARGVVEILERGCGICLDKLHVLAALARAGGMPARFCLVGARSRERDGEQVQPVAWLVETLGADVDGLVGRRIGFRLQRLLARIRTSTAPPSGRFGWRIHPHLELKVGNSWVPADPTWGDQEAAGLGIALPRLGYDPLMLWGFTGSVIERCEEIQGGLEQWLARRFFCAPTCGTLRCANLALEEARARGRQILEEIGCDEYIRRMRHLYVPVPGVSELGPAALFSPAVPVTLPRSP